MIIPEEVEAKIRHLCSRVHDVEWSGTLFYKAEGSMEDGTFKVTCVDFFVMDIGTAGFTQYDESVEVVDYMCQHPELLENGIYQGLIHSHNNMATFFSGTDTATLLSEGQDTVHFVSLIVNNAGKYTAGVTRRVTMETKAEGIIKYTKDANYKTYQDGVVTLAAAQSEEKKVSQVQKDEYIEWFGLTIEKAEVRNDFEEVDQRLAEIKKNKVKSRPNPSYTPSYPLGGGYGSLYPTYGMGRPVNREPANPPYFSPTAPTSPTLNDRVANSRTIITPEKNLIKDEAKQLDLFEGKQEEATEDNEPMPLCLIENADADLIKTLAYQALTGSIIINNESSLDINAWVNQMDKLFEKRFGSFKESANEGRYLEWLEKHIETLVYEPDENLLDRLSMSYGIDFDTADTAEVIAYDLIKFLEDLPDSYCKECIIAELRTYLPDGVDNDYQPATDGNSSPA